MNCPWCESDQVIVAETRKAGDHVIRRRRKCLECGKKFTTFEITQVMKARYDFAVKTLEKSFG